MLREGLYDLLIDEALQRALSEAAGLATAVERLDPAEAHAFLAQHLGRLIAATLLGRRQGVSLPYQLALCNRLVAELATADSAVAVPGNRLHETAARLLSVHPQLPGLSVAAPTRPDTPLGQSCLLTGTRHDPSLSSQLRKEFASADRVDILCSFIKWSGVRVLRDALHAFLSRPGTILRVITTTYTGATDAQAIEFLAGLPNTDVRVSYDTRRTRLHAKAYLFHRDTGFGSAYIGSANLSTAALTEGLEWTLKVSQYDAPAIWDKVTATFDSYWQDSEFVPFEPGASQGLRQALAAARPGGEAPTAFQFDLTPYPFQQEILDRLAAERRYHDRTRNLVVAATGTGKTVVAALDFRRTLQQWRADGHSAPRLLYVAHREEILSQSLQCFRAVLRDQNFGELLVGGSAPTSYDNLFVSIQSYNSRGLDRLSPDHYDFVIVDEFHHAAAPTYQLLLDRVQPRILLGLTATPERADGLDILHHFDHHIAAELRLPDAVNRRLLSPFQYFGVTDSVDLSRVRWERGRYVPSELEGLYAANAERAQLVIDKTRSILLDPLDARGLGFCVSVAHAEFMASRFSAAGIPSLALSAETPRSTRQHAQQMLRQQQVNFLFVVDLYNEGVDIPEVDTVLFLRPTESLTVFLQQLGRGLRLSDGKECLTIIDFIGQAHQRYDFERRYRALLDHPRQSTEKELCDGCLSLPLGCTMQFERVAQDHVLSNIRQALTSRRNGLRDRIATFTADTGQPLSLAAFVTHYGLDLDAIYRRSTWSRLCADAGVIPGFLDPDERPLERGFRRLSHWNAAGQLSTALDLLAQDETALPATLAADVQAARIATMLCASLWGQQRTGSPSADLGRLQQRNPDLHGELQELLRFLYGQLSEVPPDCPLPFATPLELHASYTRDEVLAALGTDRECREGVLFLPDLNTDLLFVTLNKTEQHYSPSTMYEDYAISEQLFHWQSQSTTSEDSPTGLRYTSSEPDVHTVLLFVREDKRRNNLACPYDYLGPVDYVSHTGSRPMSIVWQLRFPLPARLVAISRRLVAA